MKTCINKILTATCCLLMASCSDIFDSLSVNPNQIDLNSFYTTPENVEKGILGAYGYISTPRNLGACGFGLQLSRSDEASSGADYSMPGTYTGNQIWEKVANFFYGLNSSNYDYCHILKKCINETLTSTIAKNLSNCIKEVFSKEVNTNNVNIFIEAEIMNFSVEFFNEGPGGQKIYDVLAKATGPHVFTDYNPEKTRSKSERNAIVQLLRQTFFVRDPFGVSYKEDDLKRIASEIKRQSLLEAEKLFYSEQLFKTTFKK